MSKKNLDNSVIHLLHRTGQRAGDIFSDKVGLDNLTPRQYAILQTVSQKEGCSQTDIVLQTGIDRSTLAEIMRRMVKKNLLKRKRTKADARAYTIKLTERGWDLLKSAQPAVVDADKALLKALPVAKRAEFLESLKRIVATMDQGK